MWQVLFMKTTKGEVKRIQVTFTKEQWALIEKLKGELGLSDSEVVRNIVLNWLIEKSFISTSLKNKLFGRDNNDREC